MFSNLPESPRLPVCSVRTISAAYTAPSMSSRSPSAVSFASSFDEYTPCIRSDTKFILSMGRFASKASCDACTLSSRFSTAENMVSYSLPTAPSSGERRCSSLYIGRELNAAKANASTRQADMHSRIIVTTMRFKYMECLSVER